MLSSFRIFIIRRMLRKLLIPRKWPFCSKMITFRSTVCLQKLNKMFY
jgi:hypothetical protein